MKKMVPCPKDIPDLNKDKRETLTKNASEMCQNTETESLRWQQGQPIQEAN